jgi:hypothetical protein
MSNPDEWPLPTYNCGSSKHLHAIGVIANRFNTLERGMFDLYSLYTQGRLARELSDFFFLALNERTRMQALEKLVHTYEKRRKAREFFDSLRLFWVVLGSEESNYPRRILPANVRGQSARNLSGKTKKQTIGRAGISEIHSSWITRDRGQNSRRGTALRGVSDLFAAARHSSEEMARIDEDRGACLIAK